jgi:hypothetical protein
MKVVREKLHPLLAGTIKRGQTLMKVAAQSSKEVKNSVSTTLANSNRRPILKIPQYLRLQINS